MKLQARNKVMRGETDATTGNSGGSGDAPGLSLSVRDDNNDGGRDDLGISNVPDTMRAAMHWSDDNDGGSSAAADEDWE